MIENKQQKISGPRGKNAEAFEALIDAIEECRRKRPYDYQRIIICHAPDPGIGHAVACRCEAARIWRKHPGKLGGEPVVLVVEKADDCGQETLASIVGFVNRSAGVAVLLVSRPGLAMWHDRWSEVAGRIRRRTHLTMDFEA